MNILKAFLLTALFMGLEVLMSLGIYEFIEPNVIDSLSTDYRIHYFRITGLLPNIIAYLVVFHLFFKSIFDWNKGIEKMKIVNLKTVSFLLVVALGLELFDRPFFDFSKIVDYFSSGAMDSYEFSESSNILLFYRGISALIIAPIFEEIFFRKFVFGELLKKNSVSISIVVSSICFSLMHLPSYRNLIPTFIFGIICCLIYAKTKNIFHTIILHFFVNLNWLFLLAYGKTYYEWIYGLEYNFIYWSLFILGIVLSYIGIKKITAANNTSYEKP